MKEPGWLMRQLKHAEETVQNLPPWMRQPQKEHLMHGEEAMPSDMEPKAFMAGGDCRREPVITSRRRRELMAFAEELATWVEKKTLKHERCLLRRMTEQLLED